ncbi:MAG: hypothetical protein ACKOSR_01510, partial [Flavobacteriales bacterium]
MWKKPEYLFFRSLIVLLLSAGTLMAQSESEKLELADEYFRRGNMDKALPLYEDLRGDAATDRKILRNYHAC